MPDDTQQSNTEPTPIPPENQNSEVKSIPVSPQEPTAEAPVPPIESASPLEPPEQTETQPSPESTILLKDQNDANEPFRLLRQKSQMSRMGQT